jgi:hypothetical protein
VVVVIICSLACHWRVGLRESSHFSRGCAVLGDFLKTFCKKTKRKKCKKVQQKCKKGKKTKKK